jgi:Kef-type K+ transport system membrane component KefB
MLAAGRLVVVTGALQFPLCVGLALLTFASLDVAGWSVGEGPYAALYLAIAVGISSTMVVVELLYDKMEIDSAPGRITVGLLVFQDIWAIVVLAIQPDLADPQLNGIALTFAAGGLLIAAALLTSRYVLPRVFRAVAKLPELLLVLSLGWCFLLSLVAAHPAVGLSMEMGALIAGVTLATFPYNLDVIAKVISIRDFFITLFFVALGMQIPPPTADTLVVAALIAGVLLVSRVFGVWGVLHFLRAGHRSAIVPSINLSQMSEFSLVILTFGISYGHIGKDVLGSAIWAFALLAVASTYFILRSHELQAASARLLELVGLRDAHKAALEEQDAARRERPVVLLGCFRVASGLV